jgi:uncharacterized phage protein (TIGR01671 family)
MIHAIKVRCWDNVNKRMGHFEHGFQWHDEYNLWYINQIPQEHAKQITDVPCEENINIMLFSGLIDKKTTEIYQGDVVKCHDHPTGENSGIFEVDFLHGAFICKGSNLLLRDFGTAWTEVVGNIYENPELL